MRDRLDRWRRPPPRDILVGPRAFQTKSIIVTQGLFMAALDGTRVALLESHLAEEAAAHVRRFGGTPYCVAAVREVHHLDHLDAFLDRLAADRLALVLFLTDIGATLLLDAAARLSRRDETLAALRRAIVACRGPT